MSLNGKVGLSANLSPHETGAVYTEKQSEVVNGFGSQEGTIVLQPIAMRIFNNEGVYSPNKLRPKKEVSYEEFRQRYANHCQKIRVCFDKTPSAATLLQRSEWVTAYGFGWDAWYIIASPNVEDNSVQSED